MKKGFTLLEILLVVGIIAILAGIVIVAVNPTKQFAQVRNTQRKANLSELNKALYQYYIDHSHYPTTLTTTLTEICATGASSTPTGIVCTGLVDLSALVPTYLVAIPTDPQATGTSTGYLVAKNTANKIYVKASNAELSQTVALGPSDGILPDHLVSYWSFDGNANDSQGTNHGTVSGAVATTGIRSISNTAYGFNGASDYISIPSASFSLNQGTYSAWINRKSTMPSYAAIINHAYTSINRDQVELIYQSGSVYFDLSNDSSVWCGPSWTSVSVSSTADVWEYYAATWSSTSDEIRLYKNGLIVDSQICGGVIPQLIGNLKIGGHVIDNNRNFNGKIDNVRIYNKALTAEEVMNIYNTEKP